MAEDMSKHMQRQEESLSHMAEKILDHEHRTQPTEAGLRATPSLEVPNASKEAPETPFTLPYQASSTSYGPATKTVKTPYILADGTIPTSQLREFILGAIKDTQDEAAPSYSYVKPYSPRIDRLKRPQDYQPPKFQQFDGLGNPKHHISHFIETCNNAGTTGDLMVKPMREIKHKEHEEPPYHQKKACRQTPFEPEVPEDSEELQESVASSFLMNIVEDKVSTELSRDPVSLQTLKAEFMCQVILQWGRTLEEVEDLGIYRYIYEETLWENDEKPDPGPNTELSKILEKHLDKWVYRYIYEQTLWNECRPPKSEMTPVSVQSLKAEFRYEVDPQKERTLN
ncbi:hypothetical protein LIER_05066 [Lithospermum erythrorhizon]|uniref:Uncharacterized protein n=1 Tax=Lithospermum erythrorhizon TaxID=34254 RepID=A0AAV3NZB5_LITER